MFDQEVSDRQHLEKLNSLVATVDAMRQPRLPEFQNGDRALKKPIHSEIAEVRKSQATILANASEKFRQAQHQGLARIHKFQKSYCTNLLKAAKVVCNTIIEAPLDKLVDFMKGEDRVMTQQLKDDFGKSILELEEVMPKSILQCMMPPDLCKDFNTKHMQDNNMMHEKKEYNDGVEIFVEFMQAVFKATPWLEATKNKGAEVAMVSADISPFIDFLTRCTNRSAELHECVGCTCERVVK